ncbi:poly-gamma-glutamate system protein, partial [Francisella tularensis subsp. holarctica]|nr:poly-gamma-glutamate system protein [Francisella tularensis subsp. holarctica]
SVAVDFLQEGIPVMNVRVINSSIINKYGMVYNPSTVTPPGLGAVFAQKKYNTILDSILLVIEISLVVFMGIITRNCIFSF